jgi:tetratricopeptide (TPR) repeat protein
MTTQSNEEILAQQANERFEQALEFYNKKDYQRALQLWEETIELYKQLPLDNTKYKSALAVSYRKYGLTLEKLRRFEKAIAYYQHAINLGTQLLSLDNAKYKNDLALTYNNYGNALYYLRRFKEATAYYQHTIELRTQLLSLDNPEYKNDLAWGYHDYGITLDNLRRHTEAEEAIDESLNISRELEKQGIFRYRENREKIFINAIDIYMNGSFNFLPDLILEHLDPENEGSAPQSEKMHRDALEGLHKLYLAKAGEYPELRSEIFQTILKLEQIRAKYFTGTVEGAKLNAQFYEKNVGDFNKAEQILKQYVEKVPSDPIGYQQVGEFYERRQNKTQALNYFEKSIQVALKQKTEENFIFCSLQNAANLATNKEFPNFMAFNATYLALQRVNEIKEWFNNFVDLFEKEEKLLLKNLWKPINEDLDNDYQRWLAGYQSNIRETVEKELKEYFKQKDKARSRSLYEAGRLLNIPFATTMLQILLNSWEQQWERYEQEWEQANEEQRQAIEIGIIQSLQNVMVELAKKLPEEEKQAAFRELQQDFPLHLWNILKENEQNILLLAMQLKLKNILQFAGLGFGQLVEMILLQSVFTPFKNSIQNKELEMKKVEGKFAGFLSGKNAGGFTLAPMVNVINQIVHQQKVKEQLDISEALKSQLRNYFKQFPNWDTLISQSENDCEIRSKNLNEIKEIRNKCAHTGETPDLDDVNQIYNNVIKDPNHAFCRYFLTIFLKN